MNRYLQHGPRPEEYALLRGLVLAGVVPEINDIGLIIGLLPGTFLEKPRFEDRLRPESQRVLLGRMLLEKAGLRQRAVALLADVLNGTPSAAGDPLYDEILRGINLERPYAEHRRPFPVVERIEPEQALWLLGCLAIDRSEVAEEAVAAFLASNNWRERIDAAVLLDRLGFGGKAAAVLETDADKPYPFSEIMGIGKSHYDTNFRDKCYLVTALANHIDDVGRLQTFADPKRRYRDVRYGLAVGLGRRGRADGIPLLAQIATRDPISVVRRQARESLLAIQESHRLARRPLPEVRLSEEMPLEAWYPPRGLDWPPPVVEPRPLHDLPNADPLEILGRQIAAGLQAENYRDLNNSNNQAPGATRMMIRGMLPFSRAVTALTTFPAEQTRPLLRQLLAAPYPTANYLALRQCGDRDDPGLESELIEALDKCVQSSDTVRFYWTCEVLGDRRLPAAVPVLSKLAFEENPPGLHGPAGMGHGYPAARAITRILAKTDSAEVRQLLAAENIWLRAGALAGLAEARAQGTGQILEQLLFIRQPALIRDHTRVGLNRLTPPRRPPQKTKDE